MPPTPSGGYRCVTGSTRIRPVWFARVSRALHPIDAGRRGAACPSRSQAHHARDRFLDLFPMAVALELYGLSTLTYAYFQVKGDALVYFNFGRVPGDSPPRQYWQS